jgi:membrane protein DedA with SNARE-associated domain
VAARFVAGFRMLAGPLAGATGMRPLVFMAANLIGALLFVPYALALGYYPVARALYVPSRWQIPGLR